MGNENKTSVFVYIAWPFAMAAIIAGIGIHFHPQFLAWGVGLGILTVGIIYMIWQIANDGDTTLMPYVIQFLGLLAFMLLTYLL